MWGQGSQVITLVKGVSKRIAWQVGYLGVCLVFSAMEKLLLFFFHGGSENHLAINTAIAWPTHMIQSLYSNVTSVRQILGT